MHRHEGSRFAWLRASVLAGIGLVGLSAEAMPASATTEKATVALPAPVVLFLSVYAAQDYFWPKEGLDVKVIYIAGVGSMNAVISGSAEFSLSSGGSRSRRPRGPRRCRG